MNITPNVPAEGTIKIPSSNQAAAAATTEAPAGQLEEWLTEIIELGEGDKVVEDALTHAGSRTGERKRRCEAKLVREAALKPRELCNIDEAETHAQGVMARMRHSATER